MAGLDWKDKLAQAFDIDASQIAPEPEPEAAKPSLEAKQNLKIMLDKRNRNGKSVTLIVDFKGDDEAVKELAKELKAKCGAGGSARGSEILIQGDVRNKVKELLEQKGYKAKII